jgi:hypothetical protein
VCVKKAAKRWQWTITARASNVVNAFDVSRLQKFISDMEVQITDPRRGASVPNFAIEGPTPTHFAKLAKAYSPLSARDPLQLLQVKCGYCEESTPTSAISCSRRRLRPLSATNPCHSLTTMLACCLNDGYLFLVSVVAGANAGI